MFFKRTLLLFAFVGVLFAPRFLYAAIPGLNMEFFPQDAGNVDMGQIINNVNQNQLTSQLANMNQPGGQQPQQQVQQQSAQAAAYLAAVNAIPTANVPPALVAQARALAEQNAARTGQIEREAHVAERRRQQQINTHAGLTMGAMGIGGMQLAQGIAEHRADDAGARQIESITNSIRCGIANNRDIRFGEEGATPDISVEHGDLRMEIITLAQRMRSAREHLGLVSAVAPPEDQFLNLIDTSALFQGRGGTGYVDNRFETAQERLDANQGQNRAIAGGVTAGAGAIGGIMGNRNIQAGEGPGTAATAISGAGAGAGAIGLITGQGGGGAVGAIRGVAGR